MTGVNTGSSYSVTCTMGTEAGNKGLVTTITIGRAQ